MDLPRLLRDHGIPFWQAGKNVSPGWTNVRCPWCDDPSNHMGYSPGGAFICWRCGAHPFNKTLARLLKVDEQQVFEIVRQYGGHKRRTAEPEVVIRRKGHRLPGGTGPLEARHKRYLERRGFDPDRLIETWGLLATGPCSLLDDIDFKHRIIIPIYWQGKQVSFQARDVTGRHRLRYISCPPERELVPHKQIVYGRDDLWGDTGLVVEGVTDVWRFGTAALATFGTEYTREQVRVIAHAFKHKRVYVVYDNEPKAQLQAERLMKELCTQGAVAFMRTVKTADPGGMTQFDADRFVRELIEK